MQLTGENGENEVGDSSTITGKSRTFVKNMKMSSPILSVSTQQ